MANPVIFRRGYSADLPTLGMDSDSLYFIEDENTLYKSTGVNKPLARYSDVQSGFADLTELEIKVPVGVQGKLYLTKNNHIYYYDDSQWKSITAEAQLDEIEADKVTYDSTSSTLVALDTQDALDELDGKVEVNKLKIKDIEDVLEEVEIDLDKVIADTATNTSEVATIKTDVTTVKSDVSTIKTDLSDLETDIVANTTAISTLQSADGKVKLKSTDTADYLESKINTDTLQIKYNKITVKSIDGMTVGTTELNHLSGVENNIQVQINNLTEKITENASGLSYIGKFATKTDLDRYVNPTNGMLAVVEDTDGNGSTELHIYSETASSWESIGAFEFSDSFSGLKDTPSTYEVDMFLKSDGSQIVYSKVKYSELQGKPSSAVSKIDQAVTDSHTHVNTTVLDKFTEDVSGNVLYDNKELITSSTWTAFEF